MRTALIQLKAGTDKSRNVEKSVDYVNKAADKKAEFVLLPEIFNFRGKIGKQVFRGICENIPGESLNPLIDIAAKRKIYILAGSIYEKAKGSVKAYNSSIFISPRGIEAVYRKQHLFSFLGQGISEEDVFLPGKENVRVDIKGFKAGLAICFDLRFPDMFAQYAKQGVDMFCVPSAFLKETGKAHWEILLRCRAIDNLCYVLAPNQCGIDNRGIEMFGNSMVVSPWGEILVQASANKEEIIFADIKRKDLIKFRKKLGNKGNI
ncbi:MAG: hypothetical protein HQL25_03510 [Candidatus Omnitrophica bacterium]|nr:hypothetical protein [Candidatus Omnitrophota bacterium]